MAVIRRAAPAAKKPRYEVRRTNGVFQVFDTVWFGAVKHTGQDEVAATREAERLNLRRAGQ